MNTDATKQSDLFTPAAHGCSLERSVSLRGFSLTQPWASLVAAKHKRIETRSWNTSYRGLVAIHAAKGFPPWAKEFAAVERSLGRCPARIPLGAIVAVCRIMAVQQTEEAALSITAIERHLGDYTPGRLAWFLTDIRPLCEPIACKGALSLWTVPPELAERVMQEANDSAHRPPRPDE